MFCEIELTKSAVIAAMHAADENSNELERLSSLAKFQAGETLHLVSNEAIQMHGGIGVTDEYDIGFYLKRARVAEQIFGTSEYCEYPFVFFLVLLLHPMLEFAL